ncbi:hypothetical protein PR202_ga16772 [Eleusine coracana subsp. coracana]|uniref:Uncharacterized protein n=1 Tax=Eleusine coracana subsp. coracana TaxID=191504 RepID=A0AAV5CP53_ELECO|nr:hypothetical protein PR202_ga16772 [Eleusine coracana subsp. coracana]
MMAEDTISTADSVEIEEIANSMATDLHYVQLADQNFDGKSNSFQIHKVHQLVRQIDRFSYEPFVVSIGPYHRKNVTLQFMERMKWWCLDYILTLNCNKSLRDYLLAIAEIENHARTFYSDEVNLDSKTFQRMLLLDGCFILVYLNGIHGVQRITKVASASRLIPDDCNIPETRYASEGSNSNNFLGDNAKKDQDTVLEIQLSDSGQRRDENAESTCCHENPVVQWYDAFALFDLFLLENQIPFLVVKKICEVLVGSSMCNVLAEKVANYVEENLEYMTKAFVAQTVLTVLADMSPP